MVSEILWWKAIRTHSNGLVSLDTDWSVITGDGGVWHSEDGWEDKAQFEHFKWVWFAVAIVILAETELNDLLSIIHILYFS